ncbi:hypothetical protein ABFS83_12G013600 [Erythranthe nasuta]
MCRKMKLISTLPRQFGGGIACGGSGVFRWGRRREGSKLGRGDGRRGRGSTKNSLWKTCSPYSASFFRHSPLNFAGSQNFTTFLLSSARCSPSARSRYPLLLLIDLHPISPASAAGKGNSTC